MDDRSDEQLVSAYLAGERNALATIYDRFAGPLYDTAAAMLSDRHEAADAMQDVFVLAAERLGQLRDPSKLRPWLFAVLRNEVYRRTKRRRRATPIDFAASGGADMAAPTDQSADAAVVELDELAATLRSAAAGLDDRDQLVLELSTRQGLAGPELADALGVSLEQSYVLVHRMRDRVERGIGALTVARLGRRDCPDLARLLAGWDGTFNVLVRKRVARHVDACATCDRTRRAYAVLPLLGAAPAFAAPPELRDRVLSAALQPTPRPSRQRFRDDGFPVAPRDVRRSWWVAAVVLLAIVGIGGGAVALVTDDDLPAASPATDVVRSTTPSRATASTAPTPAVTVTVPATTQPTTTQPATTLPTITLPATTTPPAPGVLVVSATDIDLGATTTAATVRLSNDGASSIRWTLAPDGVAPLVVSATGSELAPGTSIDLVITIDRSTLAEGTLDRVLQLDSTGLGDGEVTVRALVERPPTVTVARSVPSISCPWSVAPTVAAIVDDETTLDSVELAWNGPGRAGRATMSEAAPGQWRGSLNVRPINGTWSWVITATDARGNIGTATGTMVVSGC